MDVSCIVPCRRPDGRHADRGGCSVRPPPVRPTVDRWLWLLSWDDVRVWIEHLVDPARLSRAAVSWWVTGRVAAGDERSTSFKTNDVGWASHTASAASIAERSIYRGGSRLHQISSSSLACMPHGARASLSVRGNAKAALWIQSLLSFVHSFFHMIKRHSK